MKRERKLICYFTKSQAGGLVRSYLGPADPKNPLASPLSADLTVCLQSAFTTGDDEKCCSTTRAAMLERAVAAGVDAKLDIWMGMPHGLCTNLGGFQRRYAGAQGKRSFSKPSGLRRNGP